MRFISVCVDGAPRDERAVFAAYKRLAPTDQVTCLRPKFTIGMPAFGDAFTAENSHGDIAV